MLKLMLTTELLSKFSGITLPVEVCDESGKVIGIYRPTITEERRQPRVREDVPRRETGKEKRYRTAEVLSHLEKQ